MTASRKKVIVRSFGPTSPPLLRGYLPASGFIRSEARGLFFELLDLEGRIQLIPLEGVRSVSFVRDFHPADSTNPERLQRKTFLARPRTEGLWVRLTLRDDEQMEGLAPLDAALADGFAEDRGIYLVPPDVRGNTQRLYVPRSAISAMQVVAVVTTPSRRRTLERPLEQPGEDAQLALLYQADALAEQAGE